VIPEPPENFDGTTEEWEALYAVYGGELLNFPEEKDLKEPQHGFSSRDES
jgi:hypothetical protein